MSNNTRVRSLLNQLVAHDLFKNISMIDDYALRGEFMPHVELKSFEIFVNQSNDEECVCQLTDHNDEIWCHVWCATDTALNNVAGEAVIASR